MKPEFDIVFSTMTTLETSLWLRVAQKCAQDGDRPAFILFDESARSLVEDAGFSAFSFFDLLDAIPPWQIPVAEHVDFLRSFGIENLRHAYFHDKLAYGRPDETTLRHKLLHYVQAADAFFSLHNVGCVVQEMGGFVATNAIFAGARKHNVPHVFYEPAPFAGRVVFTLNSFYADMSPGLLASMPSPAAIEQAARVRDDYRNRPQYVIPSKDRHSFRDMTVGRMFNAFNASRLGGKLWRKYVTHQREEFNEIGFVVRKNFMKLFRRRLFAGLYTRTNGSDMQPYVYYPFHVPHDVQLTVRSKAFFFQEALVEYISRILPPGFRILVKEHPAAVGGHPYRLVRQLLRERSNVVLVHPRESSFPLIENARAVITVNSKVGFEGIMQRARVIVMGKAFYRGKGLTYDVDNLNSLETELGAALECDLPQDADIDRFLAQIFEWTYPCELFDSGDENAQAAFESLRRFLTQAGVRAQRDPLREPRQEIPRVAR